MTRTLTDNDVITWDVATANQQKARIAGKNTILGAFDALSGLAYVDVASASTVDLGAASSDKVRITGMTTITSFGTVAAGVLRRVRFAGSLTLTHNGTSLILPTGASITTAAGDTLEAVSLGSGNWLVISYQGPSALPDATETVRGLAEMATDAEIRSAATGAKAIMAADLETASAGVALTDAATVAVDWDAGIFFTLTLTASRAIGNPTNGQPGTWRTILVQGNDGTDRTITFGNEYLGEVPTITDCDSGKWYLLTIMCITTTHFVVSSKRAKG